MYSALRSLPPQELLGLLDRSHLLGLFAVAIEGLPSQSGDVAMLRETIAPRLMVRTIFNTHILAELLHLGTALGVRAPETRPVVLKGISHWGTVYDDAIERRVRDLDLLVGSEEDARQLCDTLEAEGYEGLFFVDDERTVREHMLAGDSYSAPPYRIRRRIDIGDQDALEVQGAIEEFGGDLGLEFMSPGELVMTVDVELHTALFATETGQFIRYDRKDFAASPNLPQFDDMRTGTALAYTSAKFALDVLETVSSGSPSLKPLKLLADLIRILGRCNQNDYDDAFRLALRWGCVHHMIDALQSAKMLAPDVSLHGVPASDGRTSLDVLLDHALSGDVAEATCSA